MIVYHTVSPLRISDPRVADASVLARLIWAHLLMSDLVTAIPGLVRAGPATLAEHLGLDVEVVRAALLELQDEKRRAVEVDERARLIRIVGMVVDHARPAASANVQKHWLAEARGLPLCEVLQNHARELAELNDDFRPIWLKLASGTPLPAKTAPPQALAEGSGGASQAPAEGTPRSRSRSGSDLDLDRAPQPPEGDGAREDHSIGDARAIAEEAHAALVEARQRLGVGRPPRIDRRLLQSLGEWLANRPPGAASLLTIVRRAAERRRREFEAGQDYRRLLTLENLLRFSHEYESADLDTVQARAPPKGQTPALEFCSS